MHDVKTFFDVWVHDTIYSDEFRAQIEDHVRTLQAKTNQKVSSCYSLINLIWKGPRLLPIVWLIERESWREWRSFWGVSWSTYWPETRRLSLGSNRHDWLCAQFEWWHRPGELIKSVNATRRRITDKHARICPSVSSKCCQCPLPAVIFAWRQLKRYIYSKTILPSKIKMKLSPLEY